MQVKHFYYIETYIDKHGTVMTACNKLVDSRSQIDLKNPTCEVCKAKQQEYDNLRIE